MVNREGKVSEAQRAALRSQRNASLTLLGFALVPAAVVVAAALLATAQPMLVVAAAILALVVLRELWRAFRFQAVLSAGRIVATSGRVRLQAHNAGAGELYLETEHGVRLFQVSPEQKLGLRDGDYYTAYTAPLSDTILTIQPAGLGAGHDPVDLSALMIDETGAEKPKRDVFVLGADGELEVRAEVGSKADAMSSGPTDSF
jgi:hypothetical protein